MAWQTIVCATGLLLTAPALALADIAHFDIAAQPLPTALKAFAEQAHMQLLYRYDAIAAAKANAVSGKLDKHAALEQLLRNTGLEAVYSSETEATIRPIGTPNPSGANRPGGEESPAAAQDKHVGSRIALAQAGPGTDADEGGHALDSRPDQLQEIVVTAQKRVERLQDVPVPVTALDTQPLVASNQLRLQDYYLTIPGFSVAPASTAGNLQTLTIRGVSTGGGDNPTVGITVDDVPFGSSTFTGGAAYIPDLDPGDLARIEVLRGPQGTLYGASSMGGLVKFVTVDPSTEMFSARVEGGLSGVSGGRQAGYNVRGSVNLPLSDTSALRVSAFGRLDPGYIDNPMYGEHGINTTRAYGGHMAMLWRPSDLFSVKLSALLQEIHGDANGRVDVPTAAYPQTSGLIGLQQLGMPRLGDYYTRVQAYSAVVNAKWAGVDWVAVSGYNVSSSYTSSDASYDLGFASQAAFQVPGTAIFDYLRNDKFTQELRASASLGERLEWLLGGFYTHEYSPGFLTVQAEDPISLQRVGHVLDNPDRSTYTEYAAFGNLTFHFTKRVDVQVGGRESRIRETVASSTQGPLNVQFGSPFLVVNPELGVTNSAFTYLVTPRFRVSTDLMLYARLASGYRAGGPNAISVGVPIRFNPDRTQNYEIGVKGAALGQRLSFDASLYYIDWKDIELSLTNQQTGFGYTGNGSRAKSQGIELSVESRPIQGLRIGGWVVWSDAVLTEAFPSTATVVSQVYGAAGDRLPGVSRFSANLSVDEEFPLAARVTVFAGGNASYVGDRVGLFTASPPAVPPRQDLPAYTQVNLHAGVRSDPWTYNAFVTNAFNARGVLAGGLGATPPFTFAYIQPRTFGFSLIRTF